jgi:hypothetical protein
MVYILCFLFGCGGMLLKTKKKEAKKEKEKGNIYVYI